MAAGKSSVTLPVARNTALLSAGMAALYGMVQLAAAVATSTFVAVTGFEGLLGLGPAIFLATGRPLAAFPAGRMMDRFGRVPVLAGGFGLGILGCLITGIGATSLSVVAVVLGFASIGASIGTVMLSRAAAADMYPPERRGSGIALVLFGAVFGALLGPLVFVPLFADQSGGRLLTPWLAAAGFMVAGLVLVLNVRPDPGAHRCGAGRAVRGRGRSRAGSGGFVGRDPAPSRHHERAGGGRGEFRGDGGHDDPGRLRARRPRPSSGRRISPCSAPISFGMFGLVIVVGNIIDRVGRIRALLGGLLLLGFSTLSVVWRRTWSPPP